MLRLTYSNHFEELCRALCQELAAERRRRRQLLPATAHIVVPNHHITAYVKLAVANQLGVAANLDFRFISSFIAECVPDERRDLRVLDTPHLHALLLSVLADEALLAEDELAPVAAYLGAAGGEQDAVDLRRFQLAQQLATLFSDYRLSRGDLLRAWREGPALGDTRSAATEIWQRRLWLAIFDAERGLLARIREETGVHWVHGPELFDEYLIKDLAVPRSVHLIGFSYLPWAHHKVLERLSRFISVHVYAFNPCMEFWEDLRAGWETRLAGRQLKSRKGDAVQLSFEDLDDTPALRLWGRPGRENVRILDEQTQCDFDARFVDPAAPEAEDAAAADAADAASSAESQAAAPDLFAGLGLGAAAAEPPVSLLAALQRDILFRHPARRAGAPDAPALVAGDRSVQILGCPSIQRELEIIGNEIWSLMARDPGLRFNDIALLVGRADQELYQAHVPGVFAELHGIPYHFADAAVTGESRMVEALGLLLDLPFGRFTRPELLRLLTHPAVLARYPDVDPDDWVHWSERLGIVHGADTRDHAATYIERDLFNWQQGIRRLALGAFMAGERSGELRPFAMDGSAYLPEELPADLLPSAARFALVARSLIADARYCQQAEKPLARWRIFFDLMVDSYLAPQNDEDERNLAACREAIATLAGSDIDGRPVRYRIACELLRARLGKLRGERGELLAHGVTVAPLLPMRPIPYRVVFLAGLGEGHFPASERESPLDLRAAKRRRGDVSPRERDRYLFLETLLSARERLYLSYVSRDERTGETLQPSPVVLELDHLVRSGYTGEGEGTSIAIDHPLRRYDPRYFPALFATIGKSDDRSKSAAPAPTPAATATISDADADAAAGYLSVAPAARRQAHVLALRRHLEHTLREHGHGMPSVGELRHALSGPRHAALRERLGWTALEAATAPPPRVELAASPTNENREPGDCAADEVVPISLRMLRRFLETPLQAWAAAVLRLRESELDDPVAQADESFSTPVAPMVGLLSDVFGEHLSAGAPSLEALSERYAERAQYLELTGRSPTGVFSDIDSERHLAILQRWQAHIETLAPGPREPASVLSFGRAPETRDAGLLLPPLALPISLPDGEGGQRVVRVELVGSTSPVFADPALGAVVTSYTDKERPRDRIRGFLDHAVAIAAECEDAAARTLSVVTSGKHCGRYALAPWSAVDARAYLSELVRDLLSQRHDYLLPCEAVFKHQAKPEIPVAAEVARLKSSGRGFSCKYGPVSQIEELGPPPRADALIERRFGPLFRTVQALEERDAVP